MLVLKYIRKYSWLSKKSQFAWEAVLNIFPIPTFVLKLSYDEPDQCYQIKLYNFSSNFTIKCKKNKTLF